MKLSIEGYKSISEKQTIDIRGLTILAGANSSGKSSFMQPLLLIKQTLENDFDAGGVLLDGANVKLSNSSEIISKVPAKEKKEFTISVVDSDYEIRATYKLGTKPGVQIHSIYVKDEQFTNGFTIKEGLSSSQIEDIITQNFKEPQKKLYRRKDSQITWKVGRERCFLAIDIILKDTDNLKNLIRPGPSLDPARRLGIIATKAIHVSGIRGNPERSYKVSASEAQFPGSFENYVASTINKWKTRKEDKLKFTKLVNYLNLLELASLLDITQENETRLKIEISRHKGTKKKSDLVNIADVGFGISQILPVLVALLEARDGQIVYIEQPELHLHPRAQSKLAAIIADVLKKSKIKIIIETHSSILIRSIQTLVAKDELKKNLVSLNWFTQDKKTGQTKISSAELDNYGAFGDWPEDFDATALSVEQEYLDAVEEKSFK
jgi:predicted ATPase